MRPWVVPFSLAVAVCLLAFSPEAAWAQPRPATGPHANGLPGQRPAEITPETWQRILETIERDGYAVGPVAEIATAGVVAAEEIREETILRASDTQAWDKFGVSVAISGDTAIVGAHLEDGGAGDPANKAGAAYLFERDQGGINNWGQVKKLIASDAQLWDHFGWSVAISGDTALVGAYREDAGAGNAGAAYAFGRNQGGTNNWGEITKLIASDAQAWDQFGESVALSGDTALVGAKNESGGAGDPAASAGAAYVFERNQGGTNNWGEIKKLIASDAQANDLFGWSVAISGDSAIVGAEREDGGAGDPTNGAGAAYVFTKKTSLRFFIGDRPEPGHVRHAAGLLSELLPRSQEPMLPPPR